MNRPSGISEEKIVGNPEKEYASTDQPPTSISISQALEGALEYGAAKAAEEFDVDEGWARLQKLIAEAEDDEADEEEDPGSVSSISVLTLPQLGPGQRRGVPMQRRSASIRARRMREVMLLVSVIISIAAVISSSVIVLRLYIAEFQYVYSMIVATCLVLSSLRLVDLLCQLSQWRRQHQYRKKLNSDASMSNGLHVSRPITFETEVTDTSYDAGMRNFEISLRRVRSTIFGEPGTPFAGVHVSNG